MSIEINIVQESPKWGEGSTYWQALAEKILNTIPHHCPSIPSQAIVSLVFADDAMVQSLNHHYRGKNKPTNVLSFPAEDDMFPDIVEKELGDIIFAYETILQEAKDQQKSFEHHLQHLIIHGFLHLLGFDHEYDEEAQVMEDLEILILQDLGITNPYDTK